MNMKYILIFLFILISICETKGQGQVFCGTSAIDNFTFPETLINNQNHRQHSVPVLGETRTFWSAGYGFQPLREVVASCRAIGEHCYVFVEDSVWGQDSTITIAEINSLLTAFEIETSHQSIDSSKSILNILTENFGPVPDEIDQDEKIYILFLNTIAEGYFSPSNQRISSLSNQVEMVYIAADVNYRYKNKNEYHKYVLAHELMHLIHWGQSGNNVRWINEGCAEYAAFICGYYEAGIGDSLSYLSLAEQNNLSLTAFAGGRMSYLLTFTYMLYLSEKFGGVDIIKDIISTNSYSSFAVDEVLNSRGYSESFESIFHKWQLALFLDHHSLADTLYGFSSIDTWPFIPRHLINDVNQLEIRDTINAWAGHFIDLNDITDIELTTHSGPEVFGYLIDNTDYRVVELAVDPENVITLDLYEKDSLTLLLSNKSTSQNSYYIHTDDISSISDLNHPQKYNLKQNFPNPFNPKTNIQYHLPKAGHVQVYVYDSNGKLIKKLVDGFVTSGFHEVIFDGNDISSGIYFYCIKTDEFVDTKKMLLIK